MLGAIVGDIAGSPYEFDRDKETAHSKNFPLISEYSHFTDDTVMTLAIADGIMNTIPRKGTPVSDDKFRHEIINSMRKFGNKYYYAGYGTRFMYWLMKANPKPYNSYGNGAPMRVSPVAWAFDTLEEVEHFAEVSSAVSHNNPEGIRGAKAAAAAIYLARTGKTKDDIKNYIQTTYYYDLTRTLEDIRRLYSHDESCQRTVPEALTAFLEGKDFEDVTRCAVSLSGDADTLTAIACSVAEGFYGVPEEINDMFLPMLDDFLTDILLKWELWRA